MTGTHALRIFAAAVLAGCSSGGTGSGTGMTRVLLTDAPFPYDQVSRVDLYIERIGAGVTTDTGGNPPGTIVAPHKAFNLLALSNGAAADLGSGPLLSGQYVQVWVTINADSSSITLKDNTVLTNGHGIAFGPLSVFTLVFFTDPPLQITEQGAVVVIDLDVGRSFPPVNPADASAGFYYNSYGMALNTAMTGALRGSVIGAGDGPIPDASVSLLKVNPVYPSDTATWGVFGTTKTDATGAFKMPYVQPDAHLVLVVEAPVSSVYGAVAQAVAVTRGAETQVGTVALPRK